MELPKRKDIRLQEYDYSKNGAYFITICVSDRKKLLWNVGATCGRQLENSRDLSNYGKIIETELHKINDIYNKSVTIKKYVIMPNHIHMIIVLQKEVGGRPQVAPTISRVVKQFKGSITKQIGISIWQRSYYDHVIRNQQEYQEIWEYIDTNPLKWELDQYYVRS